MPNCYLHIGTHKTGTTTIQEFLTENRRKLLALGYYVPKAGLGHAGSGHANLARDFAGSPRFRREAGGSKALAKELKALSGEHLIISSESFEHIMRKPDLRREISASLGNHGYRIRAILYLRPQADYINSAYATQVKVLVHGSDFRSFLEAALSSGRYDYWRAFGGLLGDPAYAVDVRPFNRATIEGGLCRDFLSAIGLNREQMARFEEGPRRNASPGPKVIEAALRLARAADEATPPPEREVRHGLGYRLIRLGEERGWNQQSFCGLDGADRERIHARFDASNRTLARAAWNRDWGEVFADEPRPKPMHVFRYEEASAEEKQEFDHVVEQVLARLGRRPRLIDRARRFIARGLRRLKA